MNSDQANQGSEVYQPARPHGREVEPKPQSAEAAHHQRV